MLRRHWERGSRRSWIDAVEWMNRMAADKIEEINLFLCRRIGLHFSLLHYEMLWSRPYVCMCVWRAMAFHMRDPFAALFTFNQRVSRTVIDSITVQKRRKRRNFSTKWVDDIWWAPSFLLRLVLGKSFLSRFFQQFTFWNSPKSEWFTWKLVRRQRRYRHPFDMRGCDEAENELNTDGITVKLVRKA